MSSEFDFNSGIFSFGDFGSEFGGLVSKSVSEKKKAKKKSEEKKETGAKKKSKSDSFKLPVTLLLDGGIPVTISGEDSIEKELLMKKAAEETGLDVFSENWYDFQLIKITDGKYLVRPLNIYEVAKNEVKEDAKVFFHNKINLMSDFFSETPDKLEVTELLKKVQEITNIDVRAYLVGDTYFMVPTNNLHGDLAKLNFPITLYTLTQPDKLILEEQCYRMTAESEEEDSEDAEDSESEQIRLDVLEKCIQLLLPYYEGVVTVDVDNQKNTVIAAFETPNTASTAVSTASTKKETLYPTDAVVSMVFTKIELNADLFGGKKEVPGTDIIRYIQKLYPEYSKERTELLYDKKLNMIMPNLKSGKRGATGEYRLEDTEEYRMENSLMMDLRVNKGKAAGTGSFEWKLPKIPCSIIMEIIHFFWDVYVVAGTEAIALIYYYPEKRKYDFVIPKQRATCATVEFDRPSKFDGVLVMEIHSHASYNAFWSMQDDADELSHCLYAVAGRFQDFRFDNDHLIVRAGTGGRHLRIPPMWVLEMPCRSEDVNPLMKNISF